MLEYQTDLSATDTAALRAEAERIWVYFRVDAESAGVRNAVLTATAEPSGGVIGRRQGYTFVYAKESDGTWREVRE